MLVAGALQLVRMALHSASAHSPRVLQFGGRRQHPPPAGIRRCDPRSDPTATPSSDPAPTSSRDPTHATGKDGMGLPILLIRPNDLAPRRRLPSLPRQSRRASSHPLNAVRSVGATDYRSDNHGLPLITTDYRTDCRTDCHSE